MSVARFVWEKMSSYLSSTLFSCRLSPSMWVSHQQLYPLICLSSFFFFSWFLCSEARSFPTPGSQFTLHLEGSPISVLSRDACQPIPPRCHLYPRLSFQDHCDEAPGQGRSVGLWLKQSMLATFDVPSVFSKMQ